MVRERSRVQSSLAAPSQPSEIAANLEMTAGNRPYDIKNTQLRLSPVRHRREAKWFESADFRIGFRQVRGQRSGRSGDGQVASRRRSDAPAGDWRPAEALRRARLERSSLPQARMKGGLPPYHQPSGPIRAVIARPIFDLPNPTALKTDRWRSRASCAWAESEWDSRIGEILIQPAGWAEASRRWQSRIRKICATG